MVLNTARVLQLELRSLPHNNTTKLGLGARAMGTKLQNLHVPKQTRNKAATTMQQFFFTAGC